jgi:hypothetical protein
MIVRYQEDCLRFEYIGFRQSFLPYSVRLPEINERVLEQSLGPLKGRTSASS